MLGARLYQAQRIAERRLKNIFHGYWDPPSDPRIRGQYRRSNGTCPCWGCHHRKSGRHYKAKGDHKRRWVFLLGEG